MGDQPTVLSIDHRAALSSVCTKPTSTVRDVLRARILLELDGGTPIRDCTRKLGCSRTTVRKWLRRYQTHGLDGLSDAQRSGAPRTHGDEVVQQVMAYATSLPPDPYGSWSHTRLAQALHAAGHVVSASWVGVTLRAAGVAVHRVQGWLHRKPDPLFEQRVDAICEAVQAAGQGKRTVYSVDEKTACAVRTPAHQDTFSMSGARRREFAYIRKGTMSWYGIQDCTTGELGMVPAQGRCDSAAFTAMLDDLVARNGGEGFTIIMDNGPTHTSAHTRRWLSLNPQVSVCYTPVHASWTNPVEAQFAALTHQVLRHGWFRSRDDLDRKVQWWTTIRNRTPNPVRWAWQPAPKVGHELTM